MMSSNTFPEPQPDSASYFPPKLTLGNQKSTAVYLELTTGYSKFQQKCGHVLANERPGRKKSRIRETKHLSTDADSSTDVIGGWTKNTTKPDFFEKREKSSKTQKNSKMSRNMPNLAIRPSTKGL